MVEKYKKLVPLIAEEKDVLLFAMLKMDDLTDRWSVLFSARNVDTLDKRTKVWERLTRILAENLTDEEAQDIARVGVFPLDDHLVSEVIKYKANDTILEEKVNGSFVHEGHIFICRKEEKDNLTLKI